jgi:acyl-CoA synthetase (NDP forming)
MSGSSGTCAEMTGRAADRADLAERIRAIMAPRSVAVVGASAERHTLGNQVLYNLREFGFDGSVTCIHPRADSIEGWPAVPSVQDLPAGLDVAVVSVPAARVTGVLAELDEQGCLSAVVPAAGFAGQEQAELEAASKSLRIRFNGPNCLGVLSAAARAPLWTPSYRMDFPVGNVAIISQSGSAAISITTSPGLGFSRVISSGNETSITSADYLSWLADDDATDAIGVVIEGISDAAAFASAVARAHEAGKPVVALKVGRSPQGSRAAQAHTGALITSYDTYRAFFRRIGVAAVDDYDDMVASLQAVVARPARACAGTSVGIVAISGGQSALACDLAVENGLELTEFSEQTVSEVLRALPDAAGTNPVDIGATVGADRRRPGDALAAVLRDPGVDSVLVIQDAHDRLELWPEHTYLDHVRRVVEISQTAAKPVVLASSASANLHPMLLELVSGSPVPFVRGLRAGVIALRSLGSVRPRAAGADDGREPPAGLAGLKAELRRWHGPVGYHATRRIIEAYGIPAVPSVLAADADAAVALAGQIGYPLVAKIASPDVPHRADVGGVIVGIHDDAGLRAAVTQIAAQVGAAVPGLRTEGFELQPQLPGGTEVLLGFTSEPPFGPMVVVGTGGSLAELISDRAADLAPLSQAEATEMIANTRIGRLLSGYRGLTSPTDIAPLARVVRQVSDLAADLQDVLSAADFNPAFVSSPSGEVRIVDALFIARG